METPSKSSKALRPTKHGPTKESLQLEIAQLESQLEDQTEVFAQLSQKYSLEESQTLVASYISKMHKYNETKDAAQLVFGKLAEIQVKSIKEIHTQFGVTPQD